MKIYHNPDHSLIIEQSRVINRDQSNRQLERDLYLEPFPEPDFSFIQGNHPLPDGSIEIIGKEVQLLTHKPLTLWFTRINDSLGIIAYDIINHLTGLNNRYLCNREGYVPFVAGISPLPLFDKGAYKIICQDNDKMFPPNEVRETRYFEADITNWGEGTSVIGWKPVAY
jgi:hypothetical protein